jgi:hypothetical protein
VEIASGRCPFAAMNSFTGQFGFRIAFDDNSLAAIWFPDAADTLQYVDISKALPQPWTFHLNNIRSIT